MSIINAFDDKTPAMISPEDIVAKSENQIDTCIIMWQHKIMKELLEQDIRLGRLYAMRRAGEICGAFVILCWRRPDLSVYRRKLGIGGTLRRDSPDCRYWRRYLYGCS